MDGSSRKIIIITGPNMAGKSTYIRQIALAVILAQAGSFVPAASCEFGLLSKIFTRIGAQDNLYRGVSTFMVEMEEAANIANNADGNSLVILDEIGRGTSTYDGLSIAWALIEYLHKKNVKTAFATHYFELTHLASQLSGVVNMHIPVREWKDRLVFLHKIAEGKTSKSYGIEVGRLAGLPDGVTNRAREILSGIEKNEIDLDSLSGKNNTQEYLPLFDRKENRVKEMLKDTDVNRITPLEAINLLSKIKEEIQNED